MFITGFVLAGLGIYAGFVGAIWFLGKAFGKSIAWGLGSLLLPPVGLVFAIMNWGIAWRPLALNLLGSVGAAGGATLLAMSVASEAGAGLQQSMQLWEMRAEMETGAAAAADDADQSDADAAP